MGYALKINNVDFSSVALAHVTYIERIPCTGISLNTNTLSFDTIDETQTLIATLTPSDTTDQLTWETSNANIATVTNGVVTIHGIGTAVITAKCGSQSAQVTITQTSLKQKSPKFVAGNIIAKYDALEPLVYAQSSGQNAFADDYNSDDTDTHIIDGGSAMQLIKVPYGATRIYIATQNDTAVTISYIYFANCNDLALVGSKYYPKYIKESTFFGTKTGAAVEYGQCIGFRCSDAQVQNDSLLYAYFT